MTKTILLDTGVVVALVNRLDPSHEACLDVWKQLRARLISVDGVLVEAAHMLRRTRGGTRGAVELLRAARTEMVTVPDATFSRALDLMDRYANIPMDLVGALLTAIAERDGIDEILTLDRRGFESYRINGRKRFRILP